MDVRVEKSPKRVRVYLGGELVADTKRPRLVWEASVPYPTYYLPVEDVLVELTPTGRTKGDGEIYAVQGKDCAVRYPELPDLVRFDWDAMDEWLEEDEPVYVHARDPYARVDVLASSRHVRVELDGVTLAESRQPRILFETGLPPRYYLPLADVRMELLRPSDTQTRCPYKGTADYWNIEVNGTVREDLVWIYRTPLPESQKVAGLACFYSEHVDIYLEDELQERPRSPFS